MTNIGLTGAQYKEVLRLARVYKREAEKCREGKAYLAGCILIGAAFEAALLSMAHCFAGDIYAWKGVSAKPLMKWSLAELLNASRQLGRLPSRLSPDEGSDSERAQIGDYAEAVREIRNFVHPARYVVDFQGKRVTKRYLETSFEIVEIATDHLMYKVRGFLQAATEELKLRHAQPGVGSDAGGSPRR